MVKKKLFFVVLLVPLFAFTLHKYYVSLCEIEYVEEQQSVQIIIGIFIDDLELTLNNVHNKKLNLATDDEVQNIDSIYTNYLKESLKISINKNPKVIEYIGKEYDFDIVRFYIEITDVENISSFEIQNTVLINDFEDQQNIVKFKKDNFYKTFYLSRKNDKSLLNFQL